MQVLHFSILILVLSCQGTRFYWETKFEVNSRKSGDQVTLNQAFQLTKDMSSWHPVFGKYCLSLDSTKANLFVCFKKNEIRIVSSYSGILKGNGPIRKKPDTVRKYLNRVKEEPGFKEHWELEKYVEKHFDVKTKDVRLLLYGPGSSILKEELGP